MFLLAVETSAQAASLALLNLAGDGAAITMAMPPSQQTARWLAQAARELLDSASLKPAEVGILAVVRGPGSFTGLRIGVTFAKVFCYATSSQLVAVDTLEVLARQAGHSGTVHAVLDALRGELYHATFGPVRHGPKAGLARLGETSLLPRDQLADIARPPCCVVGVLTPEIQQGLPDGVTIVSDERALPKAATVAQVGRMRAMTGKFDDPWKLQPLYLRMNYAEEKKTSNSTDGGRP